MVRDFSKEKGTNLSKKFVANDHASLQHFNLSRNKSLRTLETTAGSINITGGTVSRFFTKDTASDFFKTVLSSITSPAPLDVVIIYRNENLGGFPSSGWCGSQGVCLGHTMQITRYSQEYQQQLRVFHEMHSVRDFRLVLCADVSECMVECAIETLEHIVKEGLDHLPHKPLIAFERRSLYTHLRDGGAAWSRDWPIRSSAM